jgi:glycosyltransferase involved in cell wall biosynthesis
MDSVFNQTFNDFEYIIVDGGSIDGSREYIQQFEERVSYWISEKDNGVYHAMNKGIVKARGEYLIFLNSGDLFYSNNSIENLIKESVEDIVYGNILVETEESTYLKTYPPQLTFQYFLEDTLPHPGTLIKASLFQKIGLYNEKNKIVSDWEFFINAICLHRVTYRYINLTFAIFNFDGISSIPENKISIQQEKDLILERYYMAFLPDYKKAYEYRETLKKLESLRKHKIEKKRLSSIFLKKLKLKY